MVAVFADCKAVCNEKDGLLTRAEEVCEKEAFCLWVKGRGSLIEEHHWTVAEKGTGNGDTL